MIKKQSRNSIRIKKHKRMRHYITGTSEKPRLCVFKSDKHMYAQVIDDIQGHTLVAASTLEKDIQSKVKNTSNKEAAALVGEILGQRAKEKGIHQVVFDRGGFVYHGKIKALADAAREAGLDF
ncbi:MAG: 50S ribosomal protein L18 [Epulopiscium sp.]|nr:50S ribosomal protein L18 [Candidatus Epulonipiscium sp.]